MDVPADEVRELIVRLPTMDDAARVGLIKALRSTKKDRNEWGGIIFQDPKGNYYSVDPMTSNNPYQVEMKGSPYDKGDKFVAMYHTHPSNDASAAYFSEGDVNAAGKVKRPSYIGVEREDAIRLYQPGDRLKHYDTGGGKTIRTTNGKLVLSKLLAGVTTPEQREKIFRVAALKGTKSE